MILVRHGPAGTKAGWRAADEMRPLSSLGDAQAQALPATLASDVVTQVWCSPSVRCRQTVEPLAAARGLHVRTSPRLSKTAHPTLLLAWLLEAGPEESWVVCTHGEVINSLYAAARRAGLVEVTTRTTTPKGALWRITTHPDRPIQLSYTAPSPTQGSWAAPSLT